MKCLSQWGNIAQLMEAVILSKKIVENSTLGGRGFGAGHFPFFFKKKNNNKLFRPCFCFVYFINLNLGYRAI